MRVADLATLFCIPARDPERERIAGQPGQKAVRSLSTRPPIILDPPP